MEFLISILALITAGTLVLYKTLPKKKTLKEKLKDMLAAEDIAKAAIIEIEKLMEECPQQKSLDDLYKDGYRYIIASINTEGKIKDVEVYKEIPNCDVQIQELLGDERMVVITK